MGDRKTPKDEPISNGPNARPRDESIAGTETGLTNDSSSGVEITDEEVKAIEEKLRRL